jgi:hypothetical protein
LGRTRSAAAAGGAGGGGGGGSSGGGGGGAAAAASARKPSIQGRNQGTEVKTERAYAPHASPPPSTRKPYEMTPTTAPVAASSAGPPESPGQPEARSPPGQSPAEAAQSEPAGT